MDISGVLGFNPRDLSSSAPKTSGYYNLSGSPIIIDDSDPNYNWSKTAAENPWCTGSGTLNDPYIIENVYYDGEMNIAETSGKQHSANCLSIYRSTAYFIVRGCYFIKSGTDEFNSGIYLAYAQNGIIYNNTFKYHHQAVFVNDFSHNNTVFYNVIEHNQDLYGPNRAMKLQHVDNCTVVKNLVINCYVGIQLFNCLGTEIRQNLLNSSLFGYPVNVGIDFMFINDSKITFNVFAGDYTGTEFIVSQVGSSGNVIQNNTISGSIPINLGTPTPPKASGDYTDLIMLASSFNNEVKHNIAYVPGHVEPGIPSYDVFTVLGAMGIVSAFLVARARKKQHNYN
ncbi:MAG: right-handed parallel beta-helix repeat-containing protein [Candidatus Lokiarchaeota archaeon]|nr:right-handed parallel beta-helix repeat-containing protein [Candidatus Lokiarchaeota archaeon]